MPTSQVKAIAAMEAQKPLQPYAIQRREVGPHDVKIDIMYCGICHSDIHQARNEWGGSMYPMVPGHEILGRVSEVGKSVNRFSKGALAGVGCFVDSCRSCTSCQRHEEQFCANGTVSTYNSMERDGQTRTYGGYSANIVVDENYALHVDEKLDLKGVAPLLCAGITTYSPLMRYAKQPKSRIGVMGLGGLGHMAVKLAAAMGHEVTMLSTSPNKAQDAKSLGAHQFVLINDKTAAKRLQHQFDVIIDTISAPHDVNAALGFLDIHGTLVMLGAAPEAMNARSMSLIGGAKTLAGSLIGGIKETQEMLDFCARKNIVSDIEICSAQDVNTAYTRILKGDVKYRFVIDMKTL